MVLKYGGTVGAGVGARAVVPAGHTAQDDAPAAEAEPGVHAVHTVVPAARYEPALHSVHTEPGGVGVADTFSGVDVV